MLAVSREEAGGGGGLFSPLTRARALSLTRLSAPLALSLPLFVHAYLYVMHTITYSVIPVQGARRVLELCTPVFDGIDDMSAPPASPCARVLVCVCVCVRARARVVCCICA